MPKDDGTGRVRFRHAGAHSYRPALRGACTRAHEPRPRLERLQRVARSEERFHRDRHSERTGVASGGTRAVVGRQSPRCALLQAVRCAGHGQFREHGPSRHGLQPFPSIRIRIVSSAPRSPERGDRCARAARRASREDGSVPEAGVTHGGGCVVRAEQRSFGGRRSLRQQSPARARSFAAVARCRSSIPGDSTRRQWS